MRFTTVSAINVAARLFSVVVSDRFSAARVGLWALVAGMLLRGFAPQLVHGYVPLVPRLPRRVAGTGESVKFATNVYLHFAFSYFTRNTDNPLSAGDTVRGRSGCTRELTTCSFSQSRSCRPDFGSRGSYA